MAEDTRYTAITGITQVVTANSNLDGTGATYPIITGGNDGTLIKSVIIKSIDNTTPGMIRLFVTGGGNTRLLTEIEVPAITYSGINPTFEITLKLNFTLQSGYVLKASTQSTGAFNVIAEGLEWGYDTVSMDKTQYTSNLGVAQIDQANPNLDGSGDLGLAYTAGSSGSYNGSSIKTIIIKSNITVSAGMVRLYIFNGETYCLFREIVVNDEIQSGTNKTFEHTIDFEDDFDLQADFSIYASTENAELFNVVVDGNDWNYA